MGRRFVLLDRDGTLIEDKHYLADPEQVKLIPGTAEGLKQLSEMGLGLVVLTNQSGIGRGYFDRSQLDRVHRQMRTLLEIEGVELAGIYFCPHTPEEKCRCRKPAIGLVEQAARELEFIPEASFMVGDKACDIELGQRVGATTFLLRTGYETQGEAEEMVVPDYVVGDMKDVAAVVSSLLRSVQAWI